jgi:hypothetical protein
VLVELLERLLSKFEEDGEVLINQSGVRGESTLDDLVTSEVAVSSFGTEDQNHFLSRSGAAVLCCPDGKVHRRGAAVLCGQMARSTSVWCRANLSIRPAASHSSDPDVPRQ